MMRFVSLKIDGAYLIELDEFRDERGSFSRQFCCDEFKKEVNIDFQIKQCNLSKNNNKGTLRGMHYQKNPYPEAKIVSCTKGALYDVIVDLRPDSPTYLEWQGLELKENDNKMLYIPPLCAHGFLTLTDNTNIYYQLGEFFQAHYYDGIRYNDPKVNIKWPDLGSVIINERDKNYALL